MFIPQFHLTLKNNNRALLFQFEELYRYKQLMYFTIYYITYYYPQRYFDENCKSNVKSYSFIFEISLDDNHF